ncbi:MULTISPECIES: LysR family transcriptional regulator [Aquitalea]|uniref:helix-turn-helix domain-containing protein n=1 Tax=Aquitalea TaxID=407217 RepID=UPI001356F8D8|nr:MULTISPECIES: LysR family transcriptional regulator [Aquitalea]
MAFSFRQLKYFVATAEAGQVSLAAMQLNITQSAVTAAIRQLEEVLVTRLFVRHPHGMVRQGLKSARPSCCFATIFVSSF